MPCPPSELSGLLGTHSGWKTSAPMIVRLRPPLACWLLARAHSQLCEDLQGLPGDPSQDTAACVFNAGRESLSGGVMWHKVINRVTVLSALPYKIPDPGSSCPIPLRGPVTLRCVHWGREPPWPHRILCTTRPRRCNGTYRYGPRGQGSHRNSTLRNVFYCCCRVGVIFFFFNKGRL